MCIQTNGQLKFLQVYLPGCETGSAHEVAAGLDLHILVILSTDLTQLESRAHLTVELILLL